MITITKPCPICRDVNKYTFDCTHDQLVSWFEGALIQDAIPQLHPDEREVLTTGMCYNCQSQVFQ